jgi:hypothetical protein
LTVETFLTKRRARYVGEIGLFAESQMAEDDLVLFGLNKELMAKLWTEKRIEQLRYLWGLVHKVADNTDLFLDKEEAMEGLKIAAGYYRMVWDTRLQKLVPRGRSLTRISDERLRLLTAKIQEVIREQIFPGMKNNELRREIEEMIGAN